MKNDEEFKSILKRKLSISSTPSGKMILPSFGIMKEPDPAHLSYLIGHLPRFTTQQRKQIHNPLPKIKKLRNRPPHQLSPTQKEAVCWFSENGLDLGDCFNQVELKKAYRVLAMRFHPDKQGGSTVRFQRLKMYERLLSLLF